MIKSLNFFRNLKKEISDIPGWRTTRKIIIFESDDWNAIRMPSLEIKAILEKKGLDMSSIYNQFDTIASSDDYIGLYSILNSFRDKNNNPAVFTAPSVLANPDFKRIKDSEYEEYFFEPFYETLRRYKKENTVLLIKQGIKEKLFCPQFHGREHLNIKMWLNAFKNKDQKTLIAFEYGVYDYGDNTKHGFLASFDMIDPNDLIYQSAIIKEGLDLFEKFYGYKSLYFVPPNGPFNNSLNNTLFENGIRYRSASKVQSEPLGNGKSRKVLHWLGQKDKTGILYITRNCFFEPSHPGKDWVDSCLFDIKTAFRWHKPAIISTHRVNYIGSLRPENRDRGLKQLNALLKEILKKWPDVEFMTTPELGKLIEASQK